MRNAPPNYDLGDHVIIKPLEDCPARVIGMELDHDGWTIVARYFQNGEAKTLKAFPDEVEHARRPACDISEIVRSFAPGGANYVKS